VQLKRILREPLLHFFILGVLIFALFSWVNDDDMRAPDEIVIDTARIDALDSQFRRVWQRPPTPEELSGLVDNWIREEVLYREGMALGLDRGDPVLRRRIAQKIEFISEELDVLPPTEQELKAWFEDYADDYRLDPRFSFRQLYFNPTVRGESLDRAIESARKALAAGNVPDSDTTLLPAKVNDASLAEIRRAFGDGFAESLAGLSVGEWLGPVASGYGAHLVRIDQTQAARIPGFDEVRAAVERDFRANRASEFRDAFYDTLRQRYTVTYEDGVRLADERGAAGRMK
jgi:hypothetical protein